MLVGGRGEFGAELLQGIFKWSTVSKPDNLSNVYAIFQMYIAIIESSKIKNHSTFKEFNKIVQDSQIDFNPPVPKELLYFVFV